jgi:hypothetical protein
MLLAPLLKHDSAACRFILRILVAAGLSTRQVDKSVNTALHIAAREVCCRLLCLLLKKQDGRLVIASCGMVVQIFRICECVSFVCSEFLAAHGRPFPRDFVRL